MNTSFSPTHPYVLEGRDLSVRFGDHTALEGLSFQVPTGAFLAIVGPNGAGKSTLIRTLLGLVKPTHGSVRVLGDLPGQHPERIGYVPQIKTFDRSFPALAVELVLTGVRRSWPGPLRRAERELAYAALNRVGALDLAERPVGRLSGGELQRVYLARAMARRPSLILLDEPATGIDALGEKDMYGMLEAYRAESGATIGMITHDWDVARYHASQVMVINRRLFGCGHPEHVLCEDCLATAYGHRHHMHAQVQL
ncbi:zinc transport system ATP-binding protein [Deinobacterium chartae]|uniref:Zinc transport system ATP-binding protein n=1 Tax=Deinobacterium chartae TaxID=521158 RepID=A0A841I6Q5_9DEIO|nr:ABC transporter ATP-binding protein [Deinobacterium chartae]MBB6100188.1 zinc transport system ATP-binding protein [Deinobacterium chartae]